MKNLMNRLLDLIKGTNLFAQKWMNVEKHNKSNGYSVRDEKDRLLRHHITIHNLQPRVDLQVDTKVSMKSAVYYFESSVKKFLPP
jgi:hypothetical protein